MSTYHLGGLYPLNKCSRGEFKAFSTSQFTRAGSHVFKRQVAFGFPTPTKLVVFPPISETLMGLAFLSRKPTKKWLSTKREREREKKKRETERELSIYMVHYLLDVHCVHEFNEEGREGGRDGETKKREKKKKERRNKTREKERERKRESCQFTWCTTCLMCIVYMNLTRKGGRAGGME